MTTETQKPVPKLPRNRDTYYLPKSQHPRHRLQADEERVNPVQPRCPLCRTELDVVSRLCDNPACPACGKKRCRSCPAGRRNFIPPEDDACEDCLLEEMQDLTS